jgi:hypothetical protein
VVAAVVLCEEKVVGFLCIGLDLDLDWICSETGICPETGIC